MRSISGRIPIGPIPVSDQRDFIDYLEKRAERIEGRFKLQIPLLSRKKGFVFYEDDERILIRYNSEKAIGFTSLCFFSGAVDRIGSESFLRGSYRFPSFLEFPKYLLLAFMGVWILYFGYRTFSGSPTLIEDIAVFVSGLIFLSAGALWFGNVSASIFARSTMKKIGDLLAEYRPERAA